jgi:hypothetical protein
VSALRPSENDKILDLGGGNGRHFASISAHRSNVWVADISHAALEEAKQQGFNTLAIEENERLPFPDQFFDVVFCSSAIEHATIPKNRLISVRTNEGFRRAAFQQQIAFAGEIDRVGRRYFVQTPHRYFPIETHTWLPVLVVFLPRTLQIRLIDFMNSWWPKKTRPDWNLLTRAQMRQLFPDARIVTERWLGVPKSIIAIKGD